MTSTQTLYSEISRLIKDGISVIPVFDAYFSEVSKKWEGKNPTQSTWKQYQKEYIDIAEFFTNRNNTGSFATITGKISGNLELIDVDNKNDPGCDALLFSAIKDLYPEIWKILRIHRTPSGGYHIPYRVACGIIPGNQKLAGWLDPENPDKKGNPGVSYFLETRGEGGFFLWPPSVGYSIYQDNPLPVLSWEDRCSLICLCQQFTRIPVKVIDKKPKKKDSDFYDETPWQHFNHSDFRDGEVNAETVLLQDGWKLNSEHALWRQFTRPGKEKGTSATYNREKNFYWIWTTSNSLVQQKVITPSSLLCELKFNNDWKQLYAYLTKLGYGKIKQKHEENIIRSAAMTGANIPQNISTQGKESFQELKTDYELKYPHGVFWTDNEGRFEINQNKMFNLTYALGCVIFEGEPYQIKGNFLHEITVDDIWQILRKYIKEEDADMYDAICNAYSNFIAKNEKFNFRYFLKHEEFWITAEKILFSTKTTGYLFYKNCYLDINADGVEICQYGEKLVFSSKVLPRDFRLNAGYKVLGDTFPATGPREPLYQSLYYDYLQKMTGGLTPYHMQCIGHYAHDYSDEGRYNIHITEKTINGGGTGKNLFATLLGGINTYWEKSGKQVALKKGDETVFQSWKGERIACIQDVPAKFPWDSFLETINGTMEVKKLYKDLGRISLMKMPKTITTSNYPVDSQLEGMARRIRYIEATMFFKVNGSVAEHYGEVWFPRDWDALQWEYYDNFMVYCLEKWLAAKCRIAQQPLSNQGWLKQFDRDFPEQLPFIEKWIETWLKDGSIHADTFGRNYDEYVRQNGIRYPLSPTKINRALKEYCTYNDIEFRYENNGQTTVRVFIKNGEKTPF